MIWWLLAAVVLAAIVVLVWMRRPRSGTARRSGHPGRTRPPGRPTGKPAPPKRKPVAPATGPQPGEIWWADVPYEDGTGHKIRPCLVLRGDARHREVLKITSQDQSDRNDHIAIPTRSWDRGADHNSYLDLTGPIRVPVKSFEDRAGALDPAIWQKVRRLHGV